MEPMSELGELAEWVALIDACIEPIFRQPVDHTDPNWLEKLREAPHPLDEAGVRSEAEGALRDVLVRYDEGGEDVRVALRALLARCRFFRDTTTLPYERTPRGFRQHLLEISVEDQGADYRDMMVELNDLCGEAHDAGVDIRPLLVEVAALSSESTGGILLSATEMDPPALW
jgi:hypothetical protein